MTTETIDSATTAVSTAGAAVPRGRRRLVAPVVAALTGGVAAAGATWILLTVLSLDIAPGSVGL